MSDALNKLRAICDAATAGPIEYVDLGPDHPARYAISTDQVPFIGFLIKKNDVDFFATASEAVPALIELVEALEWELECFYESMASHKAAAAAGKAARAKLEAILP